MLIADCLIVATALGAGVFIGADCVKLSARAKIAEMRVDLDIANRDAAAEQQARLRAEAAEREVHAQAVEFQGAVGIGQARLAQAHHDLELAEEDLALSHVEAAQLRLALLLLAAENVRLRADPPCMQQPIADFAGPLLEGNVVALNPPRFVS